MITRRRGIARRSSVCANRQCSYPIWPGQHVTRSDSGGWKHSDCLKRPGHRVRQQQESAA